MDMKAIGRRLRKLREELGQSKVFVAKKLGISYTTMCRVEWGTLCPGDELKIKLSKYYGIPVGELFFADEKPEND